MSEIEKMKQQIMSKKQEEAENETQLVRSASSVSSGSETVSTPGSSESDTKIETVLGKFDAIKIVETPPEEMPPKKPERLFLEEQRQEEKKQEERKRLEERRKRVAEEEKQEELRREERKREEQRKEEMKREERKEQLKRIKEKYSAAPATAAAGDATTGDIDENYNSDLDPDNANQSPVMATLVKKITAMRAASKNSTGYIYVFTDAPQGSAEVRVKVGSSRCPSKRLLQARHFNPDVRSVATYCVSQRVSALADVQAALAHAQLSGTRDWYVGQLDSLLHVIENSACKYPSKTIQDATTDQSES